MGTMENQALMLYLVVTYTVACVLVFVWSLRKGENDAAKDAKGGFALFLAATFWFIVASLYYGDSLDWRPLGLLGVSVAALAWSAYRFLVSKRKGSQA